jgi:hypothetical protein
MVLTYLYSHLDPAPHQSVTHPLEKLAVDHAGPSGNTQRGIVIFRFESLEEPACNWGRTRWRALLSHSLGCNPMYLLYVDCVEALYEGREMVP